MNSRAPLHIVVLICGLFGGWGVRAACMYPDRDLSGYRVPLRTESRSSQMIAVAEVTRVSALREDADDPQGVTAYVYDVKMLEVLKGKKSKQIRVRSENTSSRYFMELGEKHLLFLQHVGSYWYADACDNSAPLPDAQAVVIELRHSLRR